MKVSRPGVEAGLLLCLFLLCVKNVHAEAGGISFGEDTPKMKEKMKQTVEVDTRTGVKSRSGLLAGILGKILYLLPYCFIALSELI